jgi:hypothetical protein
VLYWACKVTSERAAVREKGIRVTIEDTPSDEAVAGTWDMPYEYVYGGLVQQDDWTPVFAPDLPQLKRRLVIDSAPAARAGYLGQAPPRAMPYGTPAQGRSARLLRLRTRRAVRSLRGRYVTPALDLDEAGRRLVRRARAAAKVVSHSAARHARALDTAAHTALLEQWIWTLAVRSAELAGQRARAMQSHYRGQSAPQDCKTAVSGIEAVSNALTGHVACVERYAAALREHPRRQRRVADGARAEDRIEIGVATLEELIGSLAAAVQDAAPSTGRT